MGSRRCLRYISIFFFVSFLVLQWIMMMDVIITEEKLPGHLKSQEPHFQVTKDSPPWNQKLLRKIPQRRAHFQMVYQNCASIAALMEDLKLKKDHLDGLISCFNKALESDSDMPYDVLTAVKILPVKFPHRPIFIINPSDTCTKRQVKTLLVSPSSPENFERRQRIRQTSRGLYAKDMDNRAALLFFVGIPISGNMVQFEKTIKNESDTYGDIVLVRMNDMYRNLLQKARAMLRWSIDNCNSADYVIKTDDDVNVTVPDLMKVIRRVHKTYPNFVIGHKMLNDAPTRTYNKWQLSELEYPDEVFPPYVLGGLIGYPMSTVKLLYEATMRVNPIWLDDVYITGICTDHLSIPVLADEMFDFEHDITAEDLRPQR